MSNTNNTPFVSIECKTIADVISKYSSDECQQHYSEQMCELIMQEDADEFLSDETWKTTNERIFADMENDVDSVLRNIGTELTLYMAEMNQKGVTEKLTPTAIKKLRELFDELRGLSNGLAKNLSKSTGNYILSKQFDDVHSPSSATVADGNRLFKMQNKVIYSTIVVIRDKINSIKNDFYMTITNGIFNIVDNSKDQANPK